MVLTDIIPVKQYVFKVFAMSGRQQSKGLQGKYPGNPGYAFIQFYANLPNYSSY